MFGELLTTNQQDALNDSDIEIIETLCSKATSKAVQLTDNKLELKPIVKLENIKTEIKSEF